MTTDKARDKFGLRRVEHLAGTARLFNHRIVDHNDFIGQRQSLVLPMGDVEKGNPGFGLQFFQLAAHPDAQERVEGGQRFIEQQDLRIGGQGTGQIRPLLLAARQLRRQAIIRRVED